MNHPRKRLPIHFPFHEACGEARAKSEYACSFFTRDVGEIKISAILHRASLTFTRLLNRKRYGAAWILLQAKIDDRDVAFGKSFVLSIWHFFSGIVMLKYDPQYRGTVIINISKCLLELLSFNTKLLETFCLMNSWDLLFRRSVLYLSNVIYPYVIYHIFFLCALYFFILFCVLFRYWYISCNNVPLFATSEYLFCSITRNRNFSFHVYGRAYEIE